MKFNPLTDSTRDTELLNTEYKSGRAIGVIRLGDTCLFFKKSRRIYYIPYEDITRVFRRVQLVSATVCCGRGNLAVENIVICKDDQELAQIQLPGERAALALMDELKTRASHATFSRIIPEQSIQTVKQPENA